MIFVHKGQPSSEGRQSNVGQGQWGHLPGGVLHSERRLWERPRKALLQVHALTIVQAWRRHMQLDRSERPCDIPFWYFPHFTPCQSLRWPSCQVLKAHFRPWRLWGVKVDISWKNTLEKVCLSLLTSGHYSCLTHWFHNLHIWASLSQLSWHSLNSKEYFVICKKEKQSL